jgi:hypothetical protein
LCKDVRHSAILDIIAHILQRLAHLGAEPGIMNGGIREELDRRLLLPEAWMRAELWS